MTTDPRELVPAALDSAIDLIRSAAAQDAAHRATPCPDFDVHHLATHLFGSVSRFAVATGGPRPELPADADLQEIADALTTLREPLLAGLRAAPAEARVTLPMGEVTVVQASWVLLTEILVHGWDLARALDVPAAWDRESAAGSLAFSRLMITEETRARAFAPAVPVAPDAVPGEQLLAHLGRDPHWSPA